MLDRGGYNPPNRMLIHQLTAAQCREVLGRTNLGRLACARDGQPYIVPVFFSFDRDDHCLYSFSTVGQKIEWMRANPKVCVEVEEMADQFHWTTVLVTGRYAEIHNAKEGSTARSRAQELFQRRPEWWLPAAAKVAASAERDQPVFYRILIDKVSGRRADRPG